MTKYHAHPYVTKTGKVKYKYLPYSCPESKQWKVLDQALSITIPKFYHAIIDSVQTSKALKNRAESLYTKFTAGRGMQKFIAYNDMDNHNKNVADIAATEGWEKAAEHMCKGLTYAEMRERYG